MQGTPAVVALLALGGSLAWTADWLSERGDHHQTGWQKRERALKPDNVRNLGVLWKQKLGSPADPLTSPVILGRVVTHRGSVELVFVAGNSAVYAVDGDFGKLFWKRELDGASTATPVLAPPAPGFNEDEDDDVPQPVRPLYVVSRGGVLHALDPGDGHDLSTWPFLPAGAKPSSLDFDGKKIYATTPQGTWSIDASRAGSSAVLLSSVAAPECEFVWKGRSLTAMLDRAGRLSVHDSEQPVAVHDRSRFRGPLATFEDGNGVRWIYATSADSAAAFRLEDQEGRFTLSRVWTSRMPPVPAPVVAGGLLFAVTASGSKAAVLYALDAATGRRLYSSGAAVSSPITGTMAVANGHVCFSTRDGTLYCFGFPVDI